MPVTFAAGAPIVHAGELLELMLMNCCSAVTEATVVTSLTTTKVLPVAVPGVVLQGDGNAAISAAYWLVPEPVFPPVDVMYKSCPVVQGETPLTLSKLKVPLTGSVVVVAIKACPVP
jgi:hypothetical protein